MLIFSDEACHKFSIFSSIFTTTTSYISFFSAVPAIDTSGIAFLIDLKKATEKRGLEVYLSYIWKVNICSSQSVNLVMRKSNLFLPLRSLYLWIQLERSWRKYNERMMHTIISDRIACIWPPGKQSLHFLDLPIWQHLSGLPNRHFDHVVAMLNLHCFLINGSACNKAVQKFVCR